VLAVPLVAGKRIRAGGAGILRPVVYFAALGLGFLFIEIFLIDRASFYLNDRASAFALVLTAMLICSGAGSMLAQKFAADPWRGMALAASIVIVWCGLLYFGLQNVMLATLSLPWLLRAGLVIACVAPVSMALGLPFPLGLSRAGSDGFLPWAWGLNGAFSVIATPLANIIALTEGFDRVLLCAGVLYVTSIVAFPAMRKSRQCLNISAT
jgi:hypothetical protein